MRSIVLFVEMLFLLPMSAVNPYVGVLLWSWVSFMSPQRLVYGFGNYFPWAMLTFAATIFGCVVAREPKRLVLNPTAVLILLFMLLTTLTSLVALAPAEFVLHKWSDTEKVFLFLLITAALVTTRRRIHGLLWIMVISIGYFGVKGGGFVLTTGGLGRVLGPPGTAIFDNNDMATALLVILPLMNYLRMHARHRIIRIGMAMAMALTLFAIVGSYSRGALLGLGAVAVFLWLKSSSKLISAAILTVGITVAIAVMPPAWLARMHTIQTYQEDSSAETRLTMWNTSVHIALARPLTGAGFYGPYLESVTRRFVPDSPGRAVHSIYFEVLAEHGFPTLIVWLAITAVGWLNSRRIIRLARDVPGLRWCSDLAKMSQVSIIAYLTAGAFLSLSYWDVYFTMLVVLEATLGYVRQALQPAGEAVRDRRTALRPSLAVSRSTG